MNRVLVAPLEQELLKGDRLRVEQQLQKPQNGRMKANLSRGLEIDVQVEHALEPVEARIRVSVRTPASMIGDDEAARVVDDPLDVLSQGVYELRLDTAGKNSE